MQKLSLIILEYNNPKMTLSTLKSLYQAKVPKGIKLEVILVDNSPVPDGVLEKTTKDFKNLTYVATHKNTGFAAGNNIGIKMGLKKKSDYFLLMNNDVKVHPLFLTNLIKKIKDGADIVVPKIYFAKGYEYHKDKYKPSELGKVIWYAGGQFDWDNIYSEHLGIDQVDTGQFDQPGPVELANFCCVLIKKSVIDLIGLLDETYFLYWEDADYSVRAKRAGFNLIYEPKAKIWHKSSGSSGSGSTLHDYYLTRNRLTFGFKYATFRTKLALVRESLRLLLTGRKSQKQGILDFFIRNLGKGNYRA
jgi:GT2 family glycosyltransferase